MSHNTTSSEMLPAAETHPTLLAIGIAGTVLDGIHDEPLEYVLRRGYAVMGMAPGLAARMCQRLADCQTEDAATLAARAKRAEADNARLRAENAELREALENLCDDTETLMDERSDSTRASMMIGQSRQIMRLDEAVSAARAALSSEQAAANGAIDNEIIALQAVAENGERA